MKKIFYSLFTIAFFAPFLISFYYPHANGFLKAVFLVISNKFNLIYYGFLILFLFLSFIKKYSKFAITTGVLYIIFFYLYIGISTFLIPKIKAQKFLKNHPNAILTTMDNLKNMPSYKLLYKDSIFVVIQKTKYDHTNPFNYKKDRRQ